MTIKTILDLKEFFVKSGMWIPARLAFGTGDIGRPSSIDLNACEELIADVMGLAVVWDSESIDLIAGLTNRVGDDLASFRRQFHRQP